MPGLEQAAVKDLRTVTRTQNWTMIYLDDKESLHRTTK